MREVHQILDLAVDTSNNDNIVTGDFDLDINKPLTSSKIIYACLENLILHK